MTDALTVIREALAAPHLQDDPASAALTPQERLENRASVIYWALFDAGLLTEPATADEMPSCVCAARGQPMTMLGVMHLADCEWLAWFRSTGGCQGDV